MLISCIKCTYISSLNCRYKKVVLLNGRAVTSTGSQLEATCWKSQVPTYILELDFDQLKRNILTIKGSINFNKSLKPNLL